MQPRYIYLYCPDCGSGESGEFTREDIDDAIIDELNTHLCVNCGEETPIGDWRVSVWQVRALLKEKT